MSVERYFFQVLANRLLTFMVHNWYTDQAIQRGFLPGIVECVEHTHTLMETLLGAKQNVREIVVALLDLANAYGSSLLLNDITCQLTYLRWYTATMMSC